MPFLILTITLVTLNLSYQSPKASAAELANGDDSLVRPQSHVSAPSPAPEAVETPEVVINKTAGVNPTFSAPQSIPTELATLGDGPPAHASVTASTNVAVAPIPHTQTPPTLAQTLPPEVAQTLPRDIPPQILPRDPIPSETDPLPTEPPTPLPPSDQLLQPGEPAPVTPETEPAEQTVRVDGFVVKKFVANSEDSSEIEVFDPVALADLAWWVALNPDNQDIPDSLIQPLRVRHCPDNLLEPPDDSGTPESAPSDTNDIRAAVGPQDLSFDDLLRARSIITQLYIECGYITSGAILPPQVPEDENNIVTIEVVEGRLEDIEVNGLGRLNDGYISSRLELAASSPLNRTELVEGLQLLQLNPLVRRISADLQTGTRPATSILQVDVSEADAAKIEFDTNNNRSPSVGSFQRGITFNHANLSGLGDDFSVTYANTEGSNQIESSYTLPVSPRNDTVNLRAGYTRSDVIEPPFDALEIESESYFYEAIYRHRIFQKPTEELFLGLGFSHQSSQTQLGIKELGPFVLSRGADNDGYTRVSALRFTQEWLRRDPGQVLAARSQVSVGVDLLDATINEGPLPDSRFLSWQGQGQWVRLLNDRDLLLLLRTGIQLTGDTLLPTERFSLGGQSTVRGYRQDAVLTDSGIYTSAEVQIPIVNNRDRQGLYLVPFLDFGTGWNVDSSTDPEDSTLLGTGLGLLWIDSNDRRGSDLTARLDWGIPLISIDSRERTWQESGIYFSIQYLNF